MSPFVQSLPAGYGIAIPVGGIAVLIVDAALRRGFRAGFLRPTRPGFRERVRERPRHRAGGADAATILTMRLTGLTPLALTGAFALVSAAPAASRAVLPWVEDDHSKALAQARAKNVPIFVEAWAPW